MNSTPQLSESAWIRRESSVQRFEDAWRSGDLPRLDDYVPADGAERIETLIELIFTDLEYRLKAGQAARIEEYLARFPELAGNELVLLDLAAAEYDLRRRREPELGVSDYLSRFPGHEPALKERLTRDAVPDAQTLCSPNSANQATLTPAAGRRSAQHIGAIPGYELLEEIGRGGMGVVWKARQHGLDRLVAVKLILAASQARPEVLARFRAEAQALARIQHPHIIQIHEIGEWRPDGSTTALPFFAMEYVHGAGLDKFCAATPQSPLDAAALIQTLAEAIHTAHQQGIIHRDLKPANVLLSGGRKSPESEDPQDSGGLRPPLSELIPKITDFGLAKRLEGGDAQTKTGDILGTPSYMAPEQARGKAAEVGPATDVYALGAILYELLTGRPPFRGPTVWGTVEQVLTEEPVPPRLLQGKLPRDLETICLKCLQKESARRYASAQELADDLGRFRRGEPIRARPVSRSERLWRWSKRNPLVAGLAAGLFVVLASGLIGMSLLYANAVNQRDKKDEALKALSAQQERTRIAQDKARKALGNVSNRLLEETFSRQAKLSEADREFLRGFLKDYEDLAATAGEGVESRELRAEGYARIGRLRQRLSELQEGEEAYRAALQLYDELLQENPQNTGWRLERARTRHNLALLRQRRGDLKEAEDLYREALGDDQALLQAEPANPSQQHRVAEIQTNLGMLLRFRNRPAEAKQELQQARTALELLTKANPREPGHARILAANLNTLGVLLRQEGDSAGAEQAYRTAISIYNQLAEAYPQVPDYRQRQADLQGNLGSLLLQDLKKPKDAETAFRAALEIDTALVKEYPAITEYRQNLAGDYNALGTLHRGAGRFLQGDAALQEALKIQETLVKEHPDVPDFRHELALSRVNRIAVQIKLKRWEEAHRSFLLALRDYDWLLEHHPTLQHRYGRSNCFNNLGHVLQHQGELAEALAAHRQALAMRKRLVEEAPKSVQLRQELANSYDSVVELLQWLGRAAEARQVELEGKGTPPTNP